MKNKTPFSHHCHFHRSTEERSTQRRNLYLKGEFNSSVGNFPKKSNFQFVRALGAHNYFVYILTNQWKTVLYVGVTNDLEVRLRQHEENESLNPSSFTGKYKVKYLVYWERHTYINDAIDREKQIKRWSRAKKVNLIEQENPEWRFLNDEIKED